MIKRLCVFVGIFILNEIHQISPFPEVQRNLDSPTWTWTRFKRSPTLDDATLSMMCTYAPNPEECKRHLRHQLSSIPTTPAPPPINPFENCTRIPNSVSIPTQSTDLHDILEDGMKKLVLNQYKDVILVLGNTGSGKTTVTQIVAGDLSKLELVLTQSNRNRAVIIDADNRIGLPTIISKTLIPEQVVDPINGNVFYDSPGFSDNRGAEIDIAANYFIKQVTNNAERLKFIFTVVEASLKIGHDRLDFDRLVHHAVRFVKDVDKFRDGIALVVTKVDNYEGPILLSDEIIREGIVEFLQRYKDTLNGQLNNNETSSDSHKSEELFQKIKFVEALLQQDDDGVYWKIELSRTPMHCGPLKGQEIVEGTKRKINQLIKRLSFVKKDQLAFGYPLKPATILKVRGTFVPDLNRRVTSEFDKIIASFAKYRFKSNKEQGPSSADECEELKTLLGSIKITEGTINATYLGIQLQERLDSIGFWVGKRFVFNLEALDSIFFFYDSLTGSLVHRNVPQWTSSTMDLAQDICDMRRWKSFLSQLEDKISSYVFQREPLKLPDEEKSNLEDTLIWINNTMGNVDSGILNLAKNKKSAIKENLEAAMEEFMEMEIRNTEFICSNGILTVYGTRIELSSFVKNGFLTKCVDANIIKIFATKSFYIDDNIVAVGRKMQIYVVAPHWSIIGIRSFNLNGEDGDALPENAQIDQDGEPGNNGGPGGIFLGISSRVENGQNLKITATGGHGSSGQNGGHGSNGKNGHNLSLNKLPSCWTLAIAFGRYQDYYEHHSPGEDGENGGNGGEGGKGGYSGTVELISLEEDTSTKDINIVTRVGSKGQDGKGGEGGFGGRYGAGMRCYSDWFLVVCKKVYCDPSPSDSVAASGLNGEDGGILNYYSAEKLKRSLNLEALLSEYSIETLKRNDWNQDIQTIFYKIENVKNLNFTVPQLIDIVLRVDEMDVRFLASQQIQTYYRWLEGKVASLPVSEESRRLQYLNAVIMSNLEEIQQNSQGNRKTITNTAAFLQSIYNNVGVKYKDLKTQKEIHTLSDNFQGRLRLRIEEILQFIDQNIRPTLAATEKEIESEMQLFLNELIDKESEKEKLEYIRLNQSKLKKAFDIRGVLSSLNIVGKVLSFFGPEASAIGSLISGTTQVLTPVLVTTSEPISSSPPQLNQKNHEEIVESLDEMLDKEIQGMDEGISNIQNHIPSLSNEKMRDISSKLHGLSETRNLVEKNHQIQNISMQLESLIDSQNDSETVDFARRILHATKMGVEIYNIIFPSSSIQNSTQSVSNNDMSRVRHEIFEYSTTEGNPNTIGSSNLISSYTREIESIASTLISRLKDLSGNSIRAFNIEKWNLRKGVLQLKQRLKHITVGFNAGEKLQRSVESLNEGLTLLGDLYDELHAGMKEQQLVQFITNINRINQGNGSGTDKDDPKILKLEIILKKNLLIGEYARARNAFKQWIFPFMLCRNHTLIRAPAQLTQDLVQARLDNIAEMQKTLQDYKSLAFECQDTHLKKSNFSSDYKTTEPFFTWKNSDWKESITELLEGKVVNLFADVLQSPNGKDAIKFTLIELRFKAVDAALQKDIDEAVLGLTVSLQHLGTSYYRVENEFYVMRGDNLTIQYNFERDSQSGQRQGRNAVYMKLENGDFLLSPYTLWTIELKNVSSTRKIGRNLNNQTTLSGMTRYAGYVDVELMGIGTYVDSGTVRNANKLSEYYEIDETIEK